MNRLTNIVSSSFTRTGLIVLCLIAAGTLGHRLYALKDMTAGSQHTLKPQSVEILTILPEPLEIEVFINPQDPLLENIVSLLNKYQANKTDLTFTLTDPALDPQRMRQLDVAPGGEIFVRYQNRTQRLTQISEQTLSMAMQRLARTKSHTVLFTTGHGERSINSKTNADLGVFAQQLAASGLNIDRINLTEQTSLSASDATVVIAGPLQRFLAREVALLLEFISDGGNLIWLTEPDSDDGLKPVAIELGINRLPGVVIDMAAQQLNVDRPDFAVANDYYRHEATNEFSDITLFPQASGLLYQPHGNNQDIDNSNQKWQVSPLVKSTDKAWTETGALSGEVVYGDDAREVEGPIPLVFALERSRNGKQQRIIVAGDGDFLADAWIANGGNRDLGNRLFNWSVDDSSMIALDTALHTDTQIDLSRTAMFLLAGVSLLLGPGLMFSTAAGVWYRRQHG